MDSKFLRRAAQVREAAKWVSDHSVRQQMLEAALYFEHLAIMGGDAPVERPTLGASASQPL